MLAALPAGEQELARDRFNNHCKVDPKHPLLRGKVVRDKFQGCTVYRVDAGANNRALAIVQEVDGVEVYNWYWIGSHESYNNRL